MPKEGIKRLLILCPAFVSDCLETLEEIAIRGKESFMQAGGEEYTMIPCLNADPLWVQALAGWIKNMRKGIRICYWFKEKGINDKSIPMYSYIKALSHRVYRHLCQRSLLHSTSLHLYAEAAERSEPEKSILQRQYKIMIRRLWLIITWPSAILTLIFGPWVMIMMGALPTWLMIKLCFVVGLYLYHFYPAGYLSAADEGHLPMVLPAAAHLERDRYYLFDGHCHAGGGKAEYELGLGGWGLLGFVIILMSAVRIYKSIRMKK